MNQRTSILSWTIFNSLDKSNIISKTDTNGIITYVNDSFCKISGYEKNEILGRNHSITKHHENPDELYKDMWNTIKIKKKKV